MAARALSFHLGLSQLLNGLLILLAARYCCIHYDAARRLAGVVEQTVLLLRVKSPAWFYSTMPTVVADAAGATVVHLAYTGSVAGLIPKSGLSSNYGQCAGEDYLFNGSLNSRPLWHSAGQQRFIAFNGRAWVCSDVKYLLDIRNGSLTSSIFGGFQSSEHGNVVFDNSVWEHYQPRVTHRSLSETFGQDRGSSSASTATSTATSTAAGAAVSAGADTRSQQSGKQSEPVTGDGSSSSTFSASKHLNLAAKNWVYLGTFLHFALKPGMPDPNKCAGEDYYLGGEINGKPFWLSENLGRFIAFNANQWVCSSAQYLEDVKKEAVRGIVFGGLVGSKGVKAGDEAVERSVWDNFLVLLKKL